LNVFFGGKMLIKLLKKKTQAMLEMAALGPVVLVSVGIVVTYVAKLNGDQYQLMQSFRKALKHSHDENKAVAYGTWDDRRQADASNPIVGHKVTSSGAGYVMWAIPSVEDPGKDPKKTMWMGINAAGGRFGPVIEYDLGEQASSGAITPMYNTITGENVSAHNVNGNVGSSRSAGVAEVMTYKIENRRYGQGRGHGR
jgi:hypothetical protein